MYDNLHSSMDRLKAEVARDYENTDVNLHSSMDRLKDIYNHSSSYA